MNRYKGLEMRDTTDYRDHERVKKHAFPKEQASVCFDVGIPDGGVPYTG